MGLAERDALRRVSYSALVTLYLWYAPLYTDSRASRRILARRARTHDTTQHDASARIRAKLRRAVPLGLPRRYAVCSTTYVPSVDRHHSSTMFGVDLTQPTPAAVPTHRTRASSGWA